MKIDEVIDTINSRPSMVIIMLGILYNFPNVVLAMVAVGTNLFGYLPYKNWECLSSSEACLNQTSQGTVYDRDTFCDGGRTLIENTDFKWELDGRTTFALDFDMLCEREYLHTLCNTLYFVGAMFGLLLFGQIMDIAGRRFGMCIFNMFTLWGIILQSLPSSHSHIVVFMLARFILGGSTYLCYASLNTYIQEQSPTKFRPITNLFIAFTWDAGYILLVPVSYYIKNWNVQSAIPAIFIIINMVAVIFIPESPKFLLLNKGLKQKAVGALKWFSRMNRVPASRINLDEIDIETTIGSKPRARTVKENLADMIRYPELGLQTLVLSWLWCVSGFLYYGFTYSWSKLSKDLYIGYLLGGISDILGIALQVTFMFLMPRCYQNVLSFGVAAASFFLAIIPYDFPGDTISFEQLMSLVGSLAVSGGWGMVIVWSSEASPTTHRAQINSWVSASGRIGSIIGTQASLLFNWSKAGSFVIFGILAISAAFIGVRLPETKNVVPPESSKDVKSRYV